MLLGLEFSAHATYTPFNTSSAGNIGIGTAHPGTALDVNGTVRMTGFTLTSGASR